MLYIYTCMWHIYVLHVYIYIICMYVCHVHMWPHMYVHIICVSIMWYMNLLPWYTDGTGTGNKWYVMYTCMCTHVWYMWYTHIIYYIH